MVLILIRICVIINGSNLIKLHRVSVMPGKAKPVKRECGVNPLRYQSLYALKDMRPSVKAGHWETEKAGCIFAYMVRVRRPALMLFRT